MNRRVVVLGLALTAFGSVVAGQTAPQDAPVAVTPQTQPGPVVVQVESVRPQLTRLHVTRDGVEQATFEATSFTVSSGPTGTIIASTGEVTMTAPSRVVTVGKFEARFPPDRTTWMLRRSQTWGTDWRLYGPGLNSKLDVGPPKTR